MAMHRVIYPEDRQVNDATVTMWYEDAFANGQLAPEFPKWTPDIDIMKRGLEDAGLVTFNSDEMDSEPDWDGQPDEMQEWHDFDPDC